MSTPMLINEDALDRHASSGAVADEACVPEVEGWASDSAVLVVKRGPNAGLRFRLNQAVTSVGRHPSSDIFLYDITVSRRHAEFHRDCGEIRVVDIGSFSGTLVNQKPVDSVVLADGDEIQIGKFRLVFRTATQPLGAPHSERSPGPLTRIPPEATGCGNGIPATSSLREKTRPRPQPRYPTLEESMYYPVEWYHPMQRLKMAQRSVCQEVPDDDPHDCRCERDAVDADR